MCVLSVPDPRSPGPCGAAAALTVPSARGAGTSLGAAAPQHLGCRRSCGRGPGASCPASSARQSRAEELERRRVEASCETTLRSPGHGSASESRGEASDHDQQGKSVFSLNLSVQQRLKWHHRTFMEFTFLLCHERNTNIMKLLVPTVTKYLVCFPAHI